MTKKKKGKNGYCVSPKKKKLVSGQSIRMGQVKASG